MASDKIKEALIGTYERLYPQPALPTQPIVVEETPAAPSEKKAAGENPTQPIVVEETPAPVPDPSPTVNPSSIYYSPTNSTGYSVTAGGTLTISSLGSHGQVPMVPDKVMIVDNQTGCTTTLKDYIGGSYVFARRDCDTYIHDTSTGAITTLKDYIQGKVDAAINAKIKPEARMW